MSKDMRKIVEAGYDAGNYENEYRRDPNPNKVEKYFLDKIISALGDHKTVLDLGCGTGLPFDRYLVENGIDVTGIDISQKHVDKARNNVTKMHVIKGDYSRYDFGNVRFGGIVSFYSIFHIPRAEQPELFKKIHSLLFDGGVALFTFGISGTEHGYEDDWCGAPMYWSTHTVDEYRKILKDCGFKIIEEQFEGEPGDDEYHLWVMVRKA